MLQPAWGRWTAPRSREARDGKPIDTVRAVFAIGAQACEEKRPLLDVGAEVYFLDRPGGSSSCRPSEDLAAAIDLAR